MEVRCGWVGPGISLVDGIHMSIDERRAVKMRPFFDRPLAVVLDLAAPEESLPLFIDRLQLEPDIEGVDRSAREKVADLARSNDYIDAHVVPAPHRSIHAAERRGERASFAGRSAWQRGLRFLAYRKRRGQLRPAHFRSGWRRNLIPGGRNRENIHA